MNRLLFCLVVSLAWSSQGSLATAADRNPIELKDGDRIVLLGDDLIERDQKHGFLETLLVQSNPQKNLTIRNLGWSGDTVFGDARAGFGTRVDGFKQLKEHVLGLKPTVILVGYGMSESFDGAAGLSSFTKGLNDLLDVLAETKATIVLISPIPHEDLGRPLPDPTAHNQSLRLYREAIAATAAQRKLREIDLSVIESSGGDSPAVTDDGIHLSEDGSWLAGTRIASALQDNVGRRWSVHVRPDGHVDATQAKVTAVEASPQRVRFTVLDASLPLPVRSATKARPAWLNDAGRVLKIDGLEPGRYTLKIDGQTIATASAEEWKSKELTQGPEFDQVERLRKVINEKNLLYFHRWRPQNETYLFGFRKHEQGNNAREIPLFDPLVEAKETEIGSLRNPVTHVYELTREP